MSRVLIIGGTGMLRPVVHELLDRGELVVVVARHPHRAEPPGGGPTMGWTAGFVPVPAQWDRPEALVDQIEATLRSRGEPSVLDGAIVWIHSPHRQSVLSELSRVLNEASTVVQLWGSAAQDPRRVLAGESDDGYPWTMRHVLLGYHRSSEGARWLTHSEVAAATLQAWDDGPAHVVAGRLDPWEDHP